VHLLRIGAEVAEAGEQIAARRTLRAVFDGQSCAVGRAKRTSSTVCSSTDSHPISSPLRQGRSSSPRRV
jgi:hypothetical protein